MGKETEPKQLWEINEVIINGNYSYQAYEDGRLYYTLATSRADLPAGFWYDEWIYALQARTEAEQFVESSGRSALDARQRGGTGNSDYQLPSQSIANNPNMGQISSSAEKAKDRRKKKHHGKK
ncbi:hypothetical protein VFPPC_14789 [Pochonia chlamydosporia 170]|uniref:Uncharacterized protein n=1 Tax=Pochonia chlamydosporia 170 TaxID=1380566 RepID=A0A179F424_METCM|nr:hypothetical protein VFPPC_14789 [Pochonia chlamydosporia 170]OAQ60155.1 hypothetical protein VFPPC_14789 [Pochonia chlamydosporia 170]